MSPSYIISLSTPKRQFSELDTSRRTQDQPMHLPVGPTAPMLAPPIPAFSNTDLMPAEAASHHSGGLCSDHRGYCVCNVCGDEATAITSPRSSITSALLEIVDISIPRKYMKVPCLFNRNRANKHCFFHYHLFRANDFERTAQRNVFR
jgi:hypothetical protein